jgi:RHS repeat-associated protein
VDFAYDLTGARSLMLETLGDALVRRTLYETNALGQPLAVHSDFDADGRIDEAVRYRYDTAGRRTELALPDGMTIAYTYDERGQLASLSGYSDGAGTTYGYDALGRHIETAREDGLATTYAYDARGNLVDITYTADETPMAGFTYSVDPRGNRTAATEVLHSATGTTERALAYTYDALSRLVGADAAFGADYAYGYDVAGNLVDMNGVARAYNAADQLIHDGTQALAYDAAGNLLGDGANAYTWDTAGRLVGIGEGDDPAYTFSYNGDGDRVAQTVGDITTTYTLDTTPALTLVIGEATGPQRTAFIHDARGIHAQVGDAPAYAVTDGLGSVRAWTSAAPPDAFITYDPYGTPDTDITGFAFTGEPRDATGLQYHRARYYDPALGAWASLDQLETPNRYAYVDGNVVNWTDPSGAVPWNARAVAQVFNPINIPSAMAAFFAMRDHDWLHIHSEYPINIALLRSRPYDQESAVGKAIGYLTALTTTYPDLINEMTGEVWEVKPMGVQAIGATEAEYRRRLLNELKGLGRLQGNDHPLNPGGIYNWNNFPSFWRLGGVLWGGRARFLGFDPSGWVEYYAQWQGAGVIAWFKHRRSEKKKIEVWDPVLEEVPEYMTWNERNWVGGPDQPPMPDVYVPNGLPDLIGPDLPGLWEPEPITNYYCDACHDDLPLWITDPYGFNTTYALGGMTSPNDILFAGGVILIGGGTVAVGCLTFVTPTPADDVAWWSAVWSWLNGGAGGILTGSPAG